RPAGRRGAERHPIPGPAIRDHETIGLAAHDKSVIAVLLVLAVIEQAPDRLGARRAHTIVPRYQCLKGDTFIEPATVKGLQVVTFAVAGGVEVRVDQRRIEATDGHSLDGSRAIGGPDIEAAIRGLPTAGS